MSETCQEARGGGGRLESMRCYQILQARHKCRLEYIHLPIKKGFLPCRQTFLVRATRFRSRSSPGWGGEGGGYNYKPISIKHALWFWHKEMERATDAGAGTW